ncbi:MAG: HAD family phosphatase [Lachnospiraceae bacterium]|nr:HAD family phosphatase [Lachnospiraceae bacterium]
MVNNVREEVKAVVFDMDGIIFDSERLVIDCWKVVAEKYAIPNIEAACNECLGVNGVETKEKFLKRYGQDFPYDAYKDEMSKIYHDNYDGGRLPMKIGVVELLQYLEECGLKVALASSTRSEVVIQQLKDAGILDYFQVVIGGDMVTRSKPQPDIFLKACEELGVAPTESFAIEDSYNGIRAAAAGRLRPLMVPDLMPPTPEMQELSEGIFETLLDVKGYLKAILNP